MTIQSAVVTACVNGRDSLSDDHFVDGSRFIAYTDKTMRSALWEQRPACTHFHSPRRNSRIHKILIHQYVEAEYSLWIDANMKVLVPVARLVEELLNHHDIAIFKHRVRNCVYEEAEICRALGLDGRDLITEQAARYRADAFPAQSGLAEACMILRRHTPAVERFNNAWWSEYCRYSVRDQISLMIAAKKSGVDINLVTPTKFDNPYFYSEPRPPGIEIPVSLPDNVLQIC